MTSSLLTLFAALVFVLALMGGLWIALKKLGLAGQLGAVGQGRYGAGGGPRRLQVMETLALTPQHRAIILRMDTEDHLVIIGPNGQSVVITHPGDSHERSDNNHC
jgi:flagellar protein FliO/FliZ